MKKLLSFLAGFVCCALLFAFAVPALASSKAANLTFKNIKVYIDGAEFVPHDVDGNVVEPFIYDNSTYMPLRSVAEAAGYGVTYDDSIPAVFLTTGDTSPAPTASPTPTEFMTLKSGYLSRIDTCLDDAETAREDLYNQYVSYEMAGTTQSSGAQAILAEVAMIDDDITAMQALARNLRMVTAADQFSQYETALKGFEAKY